MIDVIIEYGASSSSCVHEASVDGENWYPINLGKWRNARPTGVVSCATGGGPAMFRGGVENDVKQVRVRQVSEYWRGPIQVTLKAGRGNVSAMFLMPGDSLSISIAPQYVIKEELTVEEIIQSLVMSEVLAGKPYAELDSEGNVVIRNK